MSHLKRLNAPKAWPIKRKVQTFTTRPKPGPHKLTEAVSLNFLLRDMLQLTKTTKETKKALTSGNIVINGIPRKDHKFTVGILDTVSVVPTKEQFLIVFSPSGRLQAKKMKSAMEGHFAKIVNKTIVKKKKVQLNLHNGANLLVDKDAYSTGDTLIMEKGKVKKHLKFEKGATIYLIGGKHKGVSASLDDVHLMNNMQKHRITFKFGKDTFETLKEFAFVIDKPLDN